MNDNKIIKVRDCLGKFVRNALDLTNRQKAEIEGLQNELSVLKFKNSELLRDHKELNIQLEAMQSAANSYRAEIEKLKQEFDGEKNHNERLYKKIDKLVYGAYNIKKIKTEAIKEFAERLKKKAEVLKDDDDYIGYAECVRVCHIDNLVKEME